MNRLGNFLGLRFTPSEDLVYGQLNVLGLPIGSEFLTFQDRRVLSRPCAKSAKAQRLLRILVQAHDFPEQIIEGKQLETKPVEKSALLCLANDDQREKQ